MLLFTTSHFHFHFHFHFHSYVFICFFRAFLLCNLPLIESHHLHKHHSDVYALGFNGTYLCRLQFTLCYHFFMLLQLPYNEYHSIALSVVMGQMKTVKILGSEFNTYMPIFLILVSIITLIRMVRSPSKKNTTGQGLLESNEEVQCKKLVINTVLRRERLEKTYSYYENSHSTMQ